MRTPINSTLLVAVAVAVLTLGAGPVRASDNPPDLATMWKLARQARALAQRAKDIDDLENLIGRVSTYASNYSYFGNDLAELMALKTPGASYFVPMGPAGGSVIAEEFARRAATPENPQVLHQNDFIGTPIIEVADDGQTARGVWSDFGADVGSLDSPGDWLSVKFGVDFVKEDGVWKVWHFQVYPVYAFPQSKTLTQSVKDNTSGGSGRGAPPGGVRRPPEASGNPAAMSVPGFKIWIYDGKTPEPKPWPELPRPYKTFDPNDGY